MKHTITIALLAAATLIMAGRAMAQDHPVQANVPFTFMVGNGTLPAGTYVIEADSTLSNVIHIVSRENGAHVMAMTMPKNSSVQKATPASLLFHRYGNSYFLSEIRYGGTSPNADLPVSRQEKRAINWTEEARLHANENNVTIALR
jgi:hypothetical protein